MRLCHPPSGTHHVWAPGMQFRLRFTPIVRIPRLVLKDGRESSRDPKRHLLQISNAIAELRWIHQRLCRCILSCGGLAGRVRSLYRLMNSRFCLCSFFAAHGRRPNTAPFTQRIEVSALVLLLLPLLRGGIWSLSFGYICSLIFIVDTMHLGYLPRGVVPRLVILPSFCPRVILGSTCRGIHRRGSGGWRSKPSKDFGSLLFCFLRKGIQPFHFFHLAIHIEIDRELCRRLHPLLACAIQLLVDQLFNPSVLHCVLIGGPLVALAPSAQIRDHTIVHTSPQLHAHLAGVD